MENLLSESGPDQFEQPFCVVAGISGQIKDGGGIREVFSVMGAMGTFIKYMKLYELHKGHGRLQCTDDVK